MLIAICDVEKEVRTLLADKISRLFPEAQMIQYKSGRELLPDPDGMETARQLRKSNDKMILIFVTALEDYVFQAFDVGAFHYLVKPFQDEKLAEVLEKAVKKYDKLSQTVREADRRCLIIKTGDSHTRVMLSDIIYAEVFNRTITIHSTAGNIEYYGKMMELERQVGEDFFRPHRSYLVHMKYIRRYNSSMIYLEQGTVMMAKEKYSEFVRAYLNYNQRKGSGEF